MISITGYGKGAGILEQQNTSYGKLYFDQLRKINNLKILNLGVGANYIPFITLLTIYLNVIIGLINILKDL